MTNMNIAEISSWMYTSERQLARLRLAFLRAVLSQDIEAFDTELTMGKIITGVTSNMSIIQDAIGEKLGHFISSFSTLFVGIIIAFICCWQVAMLTLIVVPLVLAVGGTCTAKMNKISATRMKYLSEVTTMVEETLTQIKTVFSFVGENSVTKSFAMFMEKQYTMCKKEAIIKGIGMGLFQVVTFCSWALIVWVGAVAVSAHKSQGGETLAAVMSILFGAISITYAAPDLQVFRQAKSAEHEVFQIINRRPGICHDTKGQKPGKIVGDIEIKDVYFAYPSRKDKLILQGLSLYIPTGRVVALVGSSGCGKSTVISLLERFYDPLSGGVFVDGYNIKDLDLRFLRRNIAAVSQEPSLFTGTIKDNLKVGNLDASDDQIAQAALTANIHLFISQLPNQYSTEVGERGLQLSGGQRQRIAIARAMLKDPPILLLDEATSALDSESEKLVQDALEKAMQGRTVILIAHRMSTMINSDIIVVLENGKVAQSGTHHELLENSKFYSNLFEAQNPTNFKERNSSINEGQDSSQKTSAQYNKNIEQSMESEALLRKLPKERCTRKEDTTFFRIWFNLKKIDLLNIAIGSCAAALSGISKPLFGFFIITIGVAYYEHDPTRKVGWYSGMFSLIGLLTLFSHILQHYFYTIIGETAMKNLRESLFSAVLRNELAWFEKPENAAARVTSKIISDTSMIKTIISDRMSVIVQCVSSILIATTVSIIVNWRMALVAWAVMPCHFIGGLVQAKSAKGFSANASVAHQELTALTSESASNIRTIASFVYEEQILAKAKVAVKEPMKISRIESVKYGIIQGVSLCLWNIAHAVALWYTTVLVKKEQATFKDGIRSYQIFSLTVPSITELWTLIPMVMSAINILKPVFQILDRETQIAPDIPDIPDNEQIEGRIEFEHVSFNYPTRPEQLVLSNFSLTIEAGQRVAIVGPSGQCKSSILALTLRFYDPSKGKISIDMIDIKAYNLRWLRKQIGLVQQEPPLFRSSIRENICYGNESASETEIVKAAIEANIHHFITNLPQGYDTLVGEKGCQLSGGQKQRVAIARALVKRPAVLLLDEATSALDGETERSVMNALRPQERRKGNQQAKATQITVAHRLSTVINSDVIIVMDKGKVIEMGNHKSLMEESGSAYSKLFNLHSQTCAVDQ
ncbi:LOW QUALITY PROTEIN: ABC transporter B family member 2-like [Dioscorea cayenensis subsp. rotundata]|uniref:LOW QUALITY PROTEIN: ABC transporter B family member 2-like n=1 Tax=Dioscorea cayennensis subsp. rotundata TaxID=55577 RepID=A0AB40C8Z1_DIOCR|nr:LOW QUALITY PROTEIN: ABC transporter B family member 2-like [Dioscorea cayenensis subsp. rotundata]